MTEKTARQIEALKNQTIGVEVEMNNITRKEAAKTAAEYFGTGRYEDTARRNGYFSWSAWDADGREWKFQRDVSIAGPDDEKCEMVTPILRYEDIETLQEVCRRLRKAGAKSDATRGRRDKRLRRSHPHRSERPHAANPPQPRQHHGKPRTAPRHSPSAGQRQDERLLPHGQPDLPQGAERQKARHDGKARRHQGIR